MGLILSLPATPGGGGCWLSSMGHPQSPLQRNPSPGLVGGEEEGLHGGRSQGQWNQTSESGSGHTDHSAGLEQSGQPLIPQSYWEGYIFAYTISEASLLAQLVKNLPAIPETWVLSLGWEDPLKEGMATHSSILAWRIPTAGGAWQATVHGFAKSWTRLSN